MRLSEAIVSNLSLKAMLNTFENQLINGINIIRIQPDQTEPLTSIRVLTKIQLQNLRQIQRQSLDQTQASKS